MSEFVVGLTSTDMGQIKLPIILFSILNVNINKSNSQNICEKVKFDKDFNCWGRSLFSEKKMNILSLVCIFQPVMMTHTSTISLNLNLLILLMDGQLIAIKVFGPRPGRIVKIGMDGDRVFQLEQYLLF